MKLFEPVNEVVARVEARAKKSSYPYRVLGRPEDPGCLVQINTDKGLLSWWPWSANQTLNIVKGWLQVHKVYGIFSESQVEQIFRKHKLFPGKPFRDSEGLKDREAAAGRSFEPKTHTTVGAKKLDNPLVDCRCGSKCRKDRMTVCSKCGHAWCFVCEHTQRQGTCSECGHQEGYEYEES